MKKKLTTLFIAAIISTINLYAQESISGYWSGELSIGPNKLGVSFNFISSNDGKLTCTMDVPAQGGKNIPVEIIKNSSDSLNLNISSIRATYKGRKISNDIIEGILSQNGANLQLNLEPGNIEVKAKESELKRPQTPKEPYEYKTEDVTFSNSAEGAQLAGTLTYPINFDKAKKGSIPVVLLVSGSGGQDRNEEIFDHKPFLVIADYLAKNGIASLRYDDRGMGKSTGPTQNSTTVNNLADAEAGIAYLRNLNKFGKIGVLGHSEGGLIAFMMGSKKSVDFIISLAGSAANGVDVIIGQNNAIMTQQGVPQKLAEDYATALRIVFNDRVANKKIADGGKYIDDICKEHSLSLLDNLKGNLVQCITAGGDWLTWFVGSTPSEYISKISCPVMAINGNLDMQVLSKDNIPVIENNLPKNKKHMIKVYDSLNHMFQHCTPVTSLDYGSIEETISPEVIQDLVTWIKQVNN